MNLYVTLISVTHPFLKSFVRPGTSPKPAPGGPRIISRSIFGSGADFQKNVCPGTSRKPSPGGPRIVSQGLFGSRGALSGSIWDILMVWVSHGDSYSFAGITILCISVLRL